MSNNFNIYRATCVHGYFVLCHMLICKIKYVHFLANAVPPCGAHNTVYDDNNVIDNYKNNDDNMKPCYLLIWFNFNPIIEK